MESHFLNLPLVIYAHMHKGTRLLVNWYLYLGLELTFLACCSELEF